MKKISDFKILSLSLTGLIIFFTIYCFKDWIIDSFNLNINDVFMSYYNMLFIIVSLAVTSLFIMEYSKKSDEDLKVQFKSIGIGLGAICIYYFLPYLQSLPFDIAGVNPNSINLTLKIIYLVAFDILLASIIMIIYHKKIEKDFKEMKKKSTKLFNKYIKYWFICLFIMMVSNLFINLITNSLPSNEQAIRNIFSISPFYVFFSAVIYAPIVEELVFRYSFKKIFVNKWVFIVLSGLIFGGMHVFTSFSELSDLLYIIPYSAPGMAFAYMLYDSDNVLVPISFHLMHNGILISLQFLMALL